MPLAAITAAGTAPAVFSAPEKVISAAKKFVSGTGKIFSIAEKRVFIGGMIFSEITMIASMNEKMELVPEKIFSELEKMESGLKKIVFVPQKIFSGGKEHHFHPREDLLRRGEDLLVSEVCNSLIPRS